MEAELKRNDLSTSDRNFYTETLSIIDEMAELFTAHGRGQMNTH